MKSILTMTQEKYYTRLGDEIHSNVCDSADDEAVVIRRNRKRVKDIILRFEKNSINSPRDSSESLDKQSDIHLAGVVNPVHAHFQFPVTRAQDRHSNVSVNSLLSNLSEMSCESNSSGFFSDRNAHVALRPAPPPPEPFNDDFSENKSLGTETPTKKRSFSFNTPNTSPVASRRTRQPPVMRRKSLAGSQGHVGETLWTYGVSQLDLKNLLRQRSNVYEDEQRKDSDSESSSASEEDSEKGEEYTINNDNGKADTLSTDHSTDTLINDASSENEDNLSVSDVRSNYDNLSIKSISSFDMVPYQKYDSITLSSDEFGAEVCHAPNTEFLTVSAVNEWCISKSADPVILPIESKKEKYRRRLTERVNELIHTEKVYVERLKHVIASYIPEMSRDNLPDTLVGMKPDIFCNIERIHKFHAEEFLPALKDCENDLRKLGHCFRRYEQRFNLYVIYSRNNKRATRLVYEHKQFFQEKQCELGDRLDLSSYLLEPIQRIPRYKLFLDDLVKTYTNYDNEKSETDSRISKLSVDSDETGGSNGESSDNEETPLESLKQAKTTVECVLTAIDGIMALENIRDCPSQINLMNQGKLLRQDEFTATDNARRRRQLMRLFLFDKMILLTAVYKKELTVEFFIYKDHIRVDDLGITAKEHDLYKFTIWYKKRNLKSYKLETRDSTIRKSWVEDITSLLWEQAMHKKKLIQQQRSKRDSTTSMDSQASNEDENNDDKYKSLRGVPGELSRGEKKTRRTTWYCE